jgi:polygalacturonase
MSLRIIVGPMFAHSNHTNASATYNDSTGQILISVATPINGSNQTNFYDVVRDYGAVAGEANSATKIQNALNAARDAGTGIVYIPAGTYNVQSTLQIFSGTTLYLTPKTVIFRQFPTSPLLANGAYNASYSGYSGQSNIRIVGGIWESRGAAYPIEPAMGISIGHATDVVIQDLTISNIGGYHAIEINSSKNVKIEELMSIRNLIYEVYITNVDENIIMIELFIELNNGHILLVSSNLDTLIGEHV